jgi:hypothetical protein
MFLLFMSLAFGESLITKVKEGERAPFSGRLFNDEAVAVVLADSEHAVAQCEIRKDLEWKTQMADLQYEYDILSAKHESLEFKHDQLMEIKDEEIKTLMRHGSPQRTMWVMFGGFALGTATSLTTYYAVNQISGN